MPGKTPARLACFSLMFVSLLVSNYYNASTMTALLSEAAPSIRTFDDFLKSDIPMKLINATYMTSISGRKRVFHPKSWHRALGDVGILSLHDGLEAIRKGQAAFCAEYYILFEGIDSHFKDEEKCSLTVLSVNVVFTAIRFIRKDKHLLEMLSRGLIKALEYGISRKKRDDWIKGPPSCFRKEPFIHVRLESVSIAFGVFLIGVVVAATVFILEELYFKKSKRLRSRKSNVSNREKSKSDHPSF